MLSSWSFIALHFTLRSVIHFELTFVKVCVFLFLFVWSFSFSWILASHSGPLWSGPCLSSVSLGLFNCTCLVVLFIEKTIFHPLYCLCPFIKDELTTFMWVCLYVLCSDLLIYLSIPSSIIHCLDYCSFTILSLPIHEHGISLHLFSSLISFIRLCSFSLIDLFFPIILLW